MRIAKSLYINAIQTRAYLSGLSCYRVTLSDRLCISVSPQQAGTLAANQGFEPCTRRFGVLRPRLRDRLKLAAGRGFEPLRDLRPG